MTLQEYLISVFTTLDMIVTISAVVSVMYLLILYMFYLPTVLDYDLYQKERYNKFLKKTTFYCLLLVLVSMLLPFVEISVN